MNKRHDVVVVGAGAAGLTAANALARAGVDVLLVERRSGTSALPRATVLSVRTMELVRTWGLEDRVRDGADTVDMTMLEAPTAARASSGTRINVGYPSSAQSAVVSPTEALCVAQDHFEAVLADHLDAAPEATVRRGVEVVGVAAAASGGGAEVRLRDTTGQVSTVTAQYVVAADGARSVVRDALGIGMTGQDDLMVGIQVVFRAPLWDVLGEHRHLLYSLTEPAGSGTLLPAGQGDRWLFGLQAGYHYEVGRTPSLDEVRARLYEAIGVPDIDVRIERSREFSSGAQLAESFRSGDVFLAGDAAHRVTPRGGTGLNIAIADGWDLGWKLAWVLRGWAPARLLSSYETERRAAVAHNVERSADPLGSRRDASTELAIDIGGRIRHVWVEPGEVSTLDLLGSGLTLITGVGDRPWTDALGQLRLPLPISHARLDPVAGRSLGVGAAGAMLVRPDGVQLAGWSSGRDAAAQLRSAVETLWAGPDDADVDEVAA